MLPSLLLMGYRSRSTRFGSASRRGAVVLTYGVCSNASPGFAPVSFGAVGSDTMYDACSTFASLASVAYLCSTL